jgi:hypothetical protein
MAKVFHPSKFAFSFIEFSIVLIIISILTAAIMGGASLIQISRVSAAKSVTLASPVVGIGGLAMWVEPVSKDSFAAGEGIDGAQITSWRNIEPENFLVKNNLSATASADVVLTEDGIGDIPAVAFTAAGNMQLASFAGSGGDTMAVAVVFSPLEEVADVDLTILDAGSAGANNASVAIQSDRVVLNAGTVVETSTATNPASFVQGGQYVLLVYFNGASSKVFVDDVVEVGGAGAVIDPGDNLPNGITIGADKSGANGIAAQISEVIIFKRTLKNSEKEDVMKYLGRKYKINIEGLS